MDVNWEAAADCLRVLSHPHRLQMIYLLLQGERSVGEIAIACKILQNVASEHLTLMRSKGLIKSRKEGRKVYHSVEEPLLGSIMSCINRRFSKSSQETS